jgi:hypothetical protein
MKLKFNGKHYDGHDHVDGKRVCPKLTGQIVEVSEIKGNQLLQDYPKDFELIEESDAEKSVEALPPKAKGKKK